MTSLKCLPKTAWHGLSRWFTFLGLDPLALIRNCRGSLPLLREYLALRRQAGTSSEAFSWGSLHLCPGERYSAAGGASGHYFWQDLIVAQMIFRAAPSRHMDVGSRIDGFVAHVASYMEVDVIDIRPLPFAIPNVFFRQADIMALPDDLRGGCESLSCLHALEHFGLGRYGDSIDYEGHLKGLEGLWRLLGDGGRLYFSVPIGPQRIEFNAHRVFSIQYLLELFAKRFAINSFSFVDDHGDIHQDVTLTALVVDSNAGCWYGCGLFELTKIAG